MKQKKINTIEDTGFNSYGSRQRVEDYSKTDSRYLRKNGGDLYGPLGVNEISSNGTLSLSGEDITIAATDDVTITATDDITVTSTDDMTITGSGTLTLNSGADHLVVQPTSNHFTKIKVLRQDNTTDAYVGNTVFLYGQGSMVPNGVAVINETVTFGITFSTIPIPVATYAGNNNAGSTTWGDNTAISAKLYCAYDDPATTGFTIHVRSGDASTFGNGTVTVFYGWHTLGTLT